MKNRSPKKRSQTFIRDVVLHTPILNMTFLLVTLWLIFSAGVYFGESGAENTGISSYGKTLYWGVVAFSAVGIADMPVNGISKFLGTIWIIPGSILFFGTIVATISAYFMRPLQRPSKQIIDTIEYNLAQLDDLSIEELERLKDTTDSLIKHMKHLKEARGEQ